MARVRDEVLPVYLTIGPGGAFAVAGMRADLDRAAKAMAEGDVVEMVRVFESLKGWNL
jgi:malonyl CoA-acyl carrier protein transacylase